MSNSSLRNYALTAGATAAVASAGAASAEIRTSSGGPVSININQQDPTILFSIDGKRLKAFNSASEFTHSFSSSFFCRAGLNGVGFDFNWKIVSSGVAVDNTLGFTGSEELRRWYTYYSSRFIHTSGDLSTGTNNLIAFSLESTETHYGWINYSLAKEDDGYAFTVNSWAYNDVAGQGIIAGEDTAAGSTAVPGIGGLAALAIGAAGVRSRRQRTVA